ncbi:MAG TPA: hypothetical protein VJQ54_00115 [Candidatus Sulfotelmatobacter sp.]|nr:hypothetical protein [Candidatus Sulfotelmatobacter sp.]
MNRTFTPYSVQSLLSVLMIFGAVFGWAQSAADLARLRQSFAHPPDDCRLMMRWWWFGPAVTKPEIRRELEQMKAAGIGGVEIATLYPLALDDPETGFRNILTFPANTSRHCALRLMKPAD